MVNANDIANRIATLRAVPSNDQKLVDRERLYGAEVVGSRDSGLVSRDGFAVEHVLAVLDGKDVLIVKDDLGVMNAFHA